MKYCIDASSLIDLGERHYPERLRVFAPIWRYLYDEIESRSEFRANKHRERFLTGADPWVIALARHVGNCTVISSEKKSLTDYGLGAVCELLGVKHCDLVGFFEANNVGH